jgi:hypothetical protein
MLLKIECPECTHIGIMSAERLPAELRCWQCGTSRRVEAGARIVNRASVLEWLLGASGGPAGHRKKAVGVTPRTSAKRCSVTAVGFRCPDSRALTYER